MRWGDGEGGAVVALWEGMAARTQGGQGRMPYVMPAIRRQQICRAGTERMEVPL